MMRSAFFQPLWGKLFHIAKVGMNYWGAGSYLYSGELNCFKKIVEKRDQNGLFIIFDVGANEGNYVLALDKIMQDNSKTAPLNYQIHCFEPVKKTFSELESAVAGSKHIQLNHFGLSAAKETGHVFVPENSSVLSSNFQQHITSKQLSSFTQEQINLDTLDNYCRQNNILHINYLKIDVEGFELNVLKGAAEMLGKGAVDHIQFEFGECMIDARVFFKDFWNLLNEKYRLYKILPDSLHEITAYNEELEVFHCANFIATHKRI